MACAIPRTCWEVDRSLRNRSRSKSVRPCTCAKEVPDFDIELPGFLQQFSPSTLPSTTLSTTTSTATAMTTTPLMHRNPTPTSSKGSTSRTFSISDSRLMLVATASAGGAVLLLLLLVVLLSLVYRSRERKHSNRAIDVIPVTGADVAASSSASSPGELKRLDADPQGSNNPTLISSHDRGLDGAANSNSSNNARGGSNSSSRSSYGSRSTAATNASGRPTMITMKGVRLKGHPV